MRPHRHLFALAIASALAVVTVGDSARAEEDVMRGREVYVEHCADCHGEAGHGDGEKAARLGFLPRDFTLGAFKCRSTPTGGPPTPEDLTRVIERGLPGTPMLGMARKIDAEETADLVAYLQTLLPEVVTSSVEVIDIPQPPTLTSPAETASSEMAGQAIYGLLRCWSCHGADGRGKGPAAEGLKDGWGEPIRVYDFTRPRRYKCGSTDRDLYRTLHTGLTGSPMPSYTTAIAFAADQVGNLDALEEALGSETVRMMSDWLATQPTAGEVDGLDEAARKELIDRRTWQLIAYLRSLEQ